MKRLRLRTTLLIGWIIVIFGSQLVLEPIGMHKIIYSFIGIGISFLLLVPGLNRVPVWLVGFISGFSYIALKGVMGELSDGTLVVYMITEVSFVIGTCILAQWVNQAIHEFEVAVVDISIGNNDKLSEHKYRGQEILYREVRRARNHKRPLGLLTIGVDDESLQPALSQILREAQAQLKNQLVLSSISKILCEKLEDCDIVVQDHDRFLAVLPETIPDDLPYLVKRIKQEVTDQIGIELQIGAASLPRDGYTLDGLIEKASHNINGKKSDQIYPEAERFDLKQPLG